MPTSPAKSSASSGATNVRILAPDLARGLTLMGIAIANLSTAWLVADQSLPGAFSGGVIDNNVWDKIAIVIESMFAHVRGLPMFATMLGYGIGMLAHSLNKRGYPARAARNVLLRRYGFLALFGLIHMTLLFFGDIMFFYGVAGMIVALLMRWRTKSLLVVAGVVEAMMLLPMLASSVVLLFVNGQSFQPLGLRLPSSWGEYVANAGYSVLMQFALLVVELPLFLPLIIVGFVAARYSILSHPEEHKKLLTYAVGVAAAVILLVGLPWGLAEIGVLPTAWAQFLLFANQSLGVLTGPGIIAIIALASIPLQRRYAQAQQDGIDYQLPILVQMLVALGKRSMTGYLLQSIILLPLCASFLLGVLKPNGAAQSLLIGFSVWLVSLLVAFALEKAGKAGPFESIHRRLSYGSSGLYAQYPEQRDSVAALGPGESDNPRQEKTNTVDVPQVDLKERQTELREPRQPD